MSDEQERLTGVWAEILEARKCLMDAQIKIAHVLSVLEAMEGENG